MAERRCGYLPCGCEPAPGLRYCDPGCEIRDLEWGARPVTEERTECRCRHPECRPENENARRLAAPEATAS